MGRSLLELDLTSYLRSAADLALPRVCVVCGRTLNQGERHICLCCEADLPLTHFSRFDHNPMAIAYNAAIATAVGWEPFQYATALFHYEGDYSRISRELKYRRNFGAGRYFAHLLGREIAASPLFDDVDIVTCVPLHFTRRTRRGYNQAEVIARELWKVIARKDSGLPDAKDGRMQSGNGEAQDSGKGILFEPQLMARVRRTASQARLSSNGERAGNVRGAFAIRPAILERAEKSMCRSVRHILIIDDVFTTGSTLAACHDALRKELGPEVRLSVATLAYAGVESPI